MTPAMQVDVDAVTAELYDAFTQRHARFAATSETLVALCGPLGGTTVVDLGCGTGVTTRALLRAGAAAVVAIDVSPAMVACAARNVDDPRARFVCASAERFDTALAAPVDVVVCNAAIWAMDPAAVASAVGRALGPGGRFAFNVAHTDAPTSDLHRRMRALAGATGLQPAEPRPLPRRAELLAALTTAGLAVVRAVESEVWESVESQRDFLRLPGSTSRTLPRVPYVERLRLLDLAWAAGAPTGATVRWIHVLAERRS
ncbi:class I SAM-dependent methyltransferase [Nannocystis sp. RBIL2]|uniref:class I SAM-dependent methyltransferase n=1 Tax=Nannocystis sp. RBIL2 TaxID=2996788 RepID=UPI0022718B96|nr:class I SAM-dependent methyltransferase [Nannocystis sp. RBIL2]MCY1070223.1 class I SAM-dependent methyltransferase [Nannocystis sp. RBIL2]